MRLLFDQNISHRLVKQIIDLFPEAKQVRELGIKIFQIDQYGSLQKKKSTSS